MTLFEAIPGSVVREMLVHSVSQVHFRHSGRFLQVSQSVKFEWFLSFEGTATVGAIYVHGELLDEEATYSLAAPNYIAGGGDGYSMLGAHPHVNLGVAHSEATGAYLEHVATKAADAIPVLPGSLLLSADRIIQTASMVRLELGALCLESRESQNAAEDCDHIRRIVAAINDKTDGFFDDLLATAVIVLEVNRTAGCIDRTGTKAALSSLRHGLPLMHAVIGPSCSDDVAAVTDAAYRARENVSHTFLSGMSTAPGLSGTNKLVRTVPSERLQAKAVKALLSSYGWERIAILHDDSVWATDSASLFVDELGQDERYEILNKATMGFSLTSFEAGGVNVTQMLSHLDALQAKIVYIFAQPRVQRQIFATAHRTRLLVGEGFAWLSAWLDKEVTHREDGTPDEDAVRGAEGLLGVKPYIDPTTDTYDAYADLWRASAPTMEGCVDSDPTTFCDADGDARTMSSWGLFQADAVLLYAKAMDAIYRVSPYDPDALFAALKAAEPYDAISGALAIDADGDRVGSLALHNVQIDEDRSITPTLASSRLVTRAIGVVSAEGEVSFKGLGRFSGGMTRPPLDRLAPCLPGFEGMGGDDCSKCPPGRFKAEVGNAPCDLCAPGMHQPDSGRLQCLQCPAGKVQSRAGGADCELCRPGQYAALSPGSPVGATECLPCGAPFSQAQRSADTLNTSDASTLYTPRGIDCAGSILNGTMRFFWSERDLTVLNANATMTWSCREDNFPSGPTEERCLGGATNECIEGHDPEWPLCARCAEGWYMESDGMCVSREGVEADHDAVAAIAVGALLLIFFVAILLMLLVWACVPTPKPPNVETPPPWEGKEADTSAAIAPSSPISRTFGSLAEQLQRRPSKLPSPVMPADESHASAVLRMQAALRGMLTRRRRIHVWVHREATPMDASGKPAEGWSEEPWNRKIGEQLNEITRLHVAVELPAKAYGGSQEAALKMAEGQVKQSVVCIFLLGPGFFGDERTLQLLRVAIKHKKSIVLLLLPDATFRRTQLNEQDNKLKGLWQKLRATAVKVLNKVLNSRLMIVLAKIVPKDLLEFFKGGDGVSESELHLFPENAYNKEWTPYLPDVAEAFHAPPIPWEPQYKDACMAALLRRIGAGLRQQQVSGYVDVELSRICAEREGQQLAELSRLADVSEPKGSKAYDLYVISNSSDLTPERLMTLYAPLASFGQSMNLGRFKINQWDEIEPAMRKCRRVALVLTRHGFDSVWAMRELQCAVQLEQQGELELILIRFEGERWLDAATNTANLAMPPIQTVMEGLAKHCPDASLRTTEAVRALFTTELARKLVIHTTQTPKAFARAIAHRLGLPLQSRQLLESIGCQTEEERTQVMLVIWRVFELNAFYTDDSHIYRIIKARGGDASQPASPQAGGVAKPSPKGGPMAVRVEEVAIEEDEAGAKVGAVMRVLDVHEVKELVLSHRARSYFKIKVSLSLASRMQSPDNYRAQSVTLGALASLRMMTKSDTFVTKEMMRIQGTEAEDDNSGPQDEDVGRQDDEAGETGHDMHGDDLDAADADLDAADLDFPDLDLNIFKELGSLFKSMFKPLVAFFQINSSFRTSFSFSFPAEVQDIFTIFGLLKFDFLDLGSFRAATAGSINYGTSVG